MLSTLWTALTRSYTHIVNFIYQYIAAYRHDATEYLAFMARLKAAQRRPLSDALKKRISETDYQNLLKAVIDGQMDMTSPLRDIYRLSRKQSIRIEKGTIVAGIKVPRTFNIICTSKGELWFTVSTKRKRSSEYRDFALPPERIIAGSKRGLPAWRIDSPAEIELFELVCEYFDLTETHLALLSEEVLISQVFGNAYPDLFVANEMGEKYLNRDGSGTRVTLYSIKETATLGKLLTDTSIHLTAIDKLMIRQDILEAVAVMHDAKKVHQCLKPDNVVVYHDGSTWRAKLIDFGRTRTAGDRSHLLYATNFTQSPEIVHFYKLSQFESTLHTNLFNKYVARQSLGNRYRLNMDISACATPHPANDLWALGMLFAYMELGDFPKEIAEITALVSENSDNYDRVIARLLNPDRSQRGNIQEAFALNESYIATIQSKSSSFLKAST